MELPDPAAGPMRLFEILRAIEGEFQTRLSQVRDNQWGLPTPCAEWNVFELVGHVVNGARYYRLLLQGVDKDDALPTLRDLPGPVLGQDPLQAYVRDESALVAALRKPGALQRVCHHESGDISGEQLLYARVSDLTIHTWDLARAVSLEEVLPEAIVQLVWTIMKPFLTSGLTAPFYAPPGRALNESMSVQQRLLTACGRTP